jgi:hypothetical protein
MQPKARPRRVGPFLGLNNRLEQTRMLVEAGAFLKVARNVELTADGFLRSRDGFKQAAPGQFRSAWSDARDAYAVKDGDLVHLGPRLAQTVVVPGVGDARVSYERAPDGMVYWTNGERIGRLLGATAREIVTPAPNPVPVAIATTGALPAGRYQVCFTAVGADGESPSTEPQQIVLPAGGGITFAGMTGSTRVYATGPDGEVFNEAPPSDFLTLDNFGAPCSTFMLQAMPPGRAIAWHKGSLLVARGPYLFLSEPYRPGVLNASRGFLSFPAEISVVQPLDDGLYVCADRTYWIPGDPLDTVPTVVLPFGALRGSSTVDGRDGNGGLAAYWQSPLGVVVARPGGVVAVPQDAVLTFTGARSGATLVREQDGEKHVLAARFDVEPT